MEKKGITLVLFDVDGTLIDEAGRLEAQTRAVAWKFGESYEEMQQVVDAFFAANDKAHALKEAGQPEYFGNIVWYMGVIGEELAIAVTDEEAQQLAAAWKEAYETSHDEPELFPDATACLEALREKGIDLKVTSGSTGESRRKLLEDTGIIRYFSDIFAAIDMGFPKQDVRYWEAVMKEIDVAPEHIAVIGNQINDDIMHPQSLGMTTFYINRSDVLHKNLGPKDIVAEHTITSLGEVSKLL